MSKKYIVLDRDGVINVDLFDYVLKNEDFQFENGSLEAILKLYENDYEIIIATNQKCINLNLITADGIKQINDFWIGKVKEKGGDVLHVGVCPHRDEENCDCRKPKTGLLIAAEKKLNISLEGCYFIGDKLSDLECAIAHGCKPILVKTGYGTKTYESTFPEESLVFENLKSAVDWIVS